MKNATFITLVISNIDLIILLNLLRRRGNSIRYELRNGKNKRWWVFFEPEMAIYKIFGRKLPTFSVLGQIEI